MDRRPAPATAWVIFGADTVTAEVASTADERAQGLMYRESLGQNAGMLFVFPDNSVRSFWMQNTYIALDIAFMDPSFRIVDIQQMDPMTTRLRSTRAGSRPTASRWGTCRRWSSAADVARWRWVAGRWERIPFGSGPRRPQAVTRSSTSTSAATSSSVL